jgi:ribosomal protein L37AE/L43A
MLDFDLHQWFSVEELELCPSCGERAGIRVEVSGAFVCFACGLIQAREGETTVEGLQRLEP